MAAAWVILWFICIVVCFFAQYELAKSIGVSDMFPETYHKLRFPVYILFLIAFVLLAINNPF